MAKFERCWISFAVIFLSFLSPRPAMAEGLEVKAYEANTKDILRILGIRHLGATVTLPEPVNAIETRIRLDLYRKGEKVSRPEVSNGFVFTDKQQSFDISVDIVDTDQFTLANAPAKSHRFFVKFSNGSSEGSSTQDVPKTEFNAEGGGSSSVIGQRRAENLVNDDGFTEVPLICYITGDGNSKTMMETVKDTVAANPESDILVVVLEYKVHAAKATAD